MIDIFCWAKIRKGNRVAKDRMEKMAVIRFLFVSKETNLERLWNDFGRTLILFVWGSE